MLRIAAILIALLCAGPALAQRDSTARTVDIERVETRDERRQVLVDHMHHAHLRFAVDVFARNRLGDAFDALVGHDAHEHVRLSGHAPGGPLHHMGQRQLDGDRLHASDLHGNHRLSFRLAARCASGASQAECRVRAGRKRVSLVRFRYTTLQAEGRGVPCALMLPKGVWHFPEEAL